MADTNTIDREYRTVGGSSTHILFNFPGIGFLYMGSIISLSYSIYRDKASVYNLGQLTIDGFAIGKRYVAGTIIKTVFLEDDLGLFLNSMKAKLGIKSDILSVNGSSNSKEIHNLLKDDIAPFDIIIVMTSEYGDFSVQETVYGATLINNGQVCSIQDLITETTMSFIARDLKQAHDVSEGGSSLVAKSSYMTGSKLLSSVSDRDLLGPTKDVYNTGRPDPTPIAADPNSPATPLPVEVRVKPNIVLDNTTIVTDGDTIKIPGKDGKKDLAVRFAGFDTPETEHKSLGIKLQPYGEEAKAYLKSLLATGNYGKDLVQLPGDTKKRALVLDKQLARDMVGAGMAWAFDDPRLDRAFVAELKMIEANAFNAKSGLWNSNKDYKPVRPSVWRKD